MSSSCTRHCAEAGRAAGPSRAPSGRMTAAPVGIQAGGHGGGRGESTRSELFRTTLRSLGSDGYGHFADDVPAVTLAVSTLMSLFGMNRRRLRAALGHLAAEHPGETRFGTAVAAGARPPDRRAAGSRTRALSGAA
ncbi:iron-containing redox enzyme family protein [Amycolatopsis sp. NBC_00355]|uniref:iron-containing redox enzyme family protein n=1 Tax=Amycolatopsis sp. NBC_00355 TaxID=2975957 RepID=UPI002E2676DE